MLETFFPLLSVVLIDTVRDFPSAETIRTTNRRAFEELWPALAQGDENHADADQRGTQEKARG